MTSNKIFPKEWMEIHPYTNTTPTDMYFTTLANELYRQEFPPELPDIYRRKMCLYASAYLEDTISGLGLWASFIGEHERLYGKLLPFWPAEENYVRDEVNETDLRFIIWNTWEKATYPHPYINPNDERIIKLAASFYDTLSKAYETAPENERLNGYFTKFNSEKEAEHKLTWLFAHTYLTEPAVAPYIKDMAPHHRFIIPTGPLALFLHEWIGILSDETSWKTVKDLFPVPETLLEDMKKTHAEIYQKFTEGTGGKRIVYLDGYESLHRFLADILKWPDDEDHMLPQLKKHKDFILMVHPEKGILLAKDICTYIADKNNPLYDKEEAQKHAFRLLTEKMLCPPDLLTYCITNRLLPDAMLPGGKEQMRVSQNADFIARHALLSFYRGD